MMFNNKYNMKFTSIFIFCLLSHLTFGHNPQGTEHAATRLWNLSTSSQTLEGSFLMYKDGDVYIEQADDAVVHFPISGLLAPDQAFVKSKYAQIRELNNELSAASSPATKAPDGFDFTLGLAGLLTMLLAVGLVRLAGKNRKRLLFPVFMVGVLMLLYSFTVHVRKMVVNGTNPAFIDSAFTPFKPKVFTHWDANYFYVESKGIPDHPMMKGITGWQQQVPIPQCYIGNNAWSIPLNPVIAATPVPVSPAHFTRGAIAIAANGIPIFNPYTNTGVDALVDGQLDNWGGHCGRGDDYHYHIAPLTLYNQTSATLPIAFALDGFAVYGALEPNGNPMTTLDANHGHYGANGVYHYHGTTNFPYMVGNMVGQVTEDNTHQIIPQAAASPIRPAQTPLQGAVITDCQPNGSNNGYILKYVKGGLNYSVDYHWTNAGLYTFKFISPTDTVTQTYNGFAQCQIPVATEEVNLAERNTVIYPNPATDAFSVIFNDPNLANELRSISIYDLDGKLVYQAMPTGKAIGVRHFGKGVYLVQLRFASYEITKKLMVQ
jgi:hypothetical protein